MTLMLIAHVTVHGGMQGILNINSAQCGSSSGFCGYLSLMIIVIIMVIRQRGEPITKVERVSLWIGGVVVDISPKDRWDRWCCNDSR